MSRLKYKNQDILKDAKKYNNRRDWKKYSPAMYELARPRNRNILDQATRHMDRLPNNTVKKWTVQAIIKDAKKYQHKSDWSKNSNSAYNAAKARGCFEKAIKHMVPLGNIMRRCVYSIKIKDKKIIYIGLTYNFKKRIRAHLKTKRFKEISKRFGDIAIIPKKLTGYTSLERAIFNEKKYENFYRNKGFKILNIAKTGGIGGGLIKWTKEAVIISAKKFKTISTWSNKFRSAVNAAHDKGWMEEATAHMIRPVWQGLRIWTREKIIEDAKKYKHRARWSEESGGAYGAAQKMGILKIATKHMTRPIVTNAWRIGLKKPVKWTDKELKNSASKYSTLYEWRKKEPSAYATTSTRKMLDKITSHMKKMKLYSFWTKEKVMSSALKYKTKISWQLNDPKAYNAARRLKIYNKATKHMYSAEGAKRGSDGRFKKSLRTYSV
jgi:predicted GIY-YIG superfamily endonuclease